MDGRDELGSPQGYNTDLMAYFDLEDLRPVEETGGYVGINADAEVGYRPDGTKVYVKDADSRSDDVVQSHIASSIFGKHLRSATPDIAYDDAYRKIMIEEMPGEMVEGGLDGSEFDSFHRAAAEKMLMGDIDYSGNFLTTGTEVVPIDYDQTGRELKTAKKTLETGIGEYLEDDLLNRKASEIARKIDLEELEEDLREERYLDNRWTNDAEGNDPAAWEGLFVGSIDNILENIRMFRH
jgi:hypothetical protein